MTSPLATFSGFLQIAYVTADIERAIEFMSTHHHVAQLPRNGV